MSIWVAILIVIAVSAVAGGLMLLLRRWAPAGGTFSDSDRASSVFGMLASAFAIFLGFVIFLAFSDYDKAKGDAALEAQTTLQQFENSRLFGPTAQRTLEGELICYARSVVHDEWPLMTGTDRRSPLTTQWVVALERSSEQVPVVGQKAVAAFSLWLSQTAQRANARGSRLQEAQHPLPPLLWVLLGIAGVLLIGYVLMYADSQERVRAQVMMASSVTAVTAAGILLIVFLNSPYGAGAGTIKPVDMANTLRLMEQEYPARSPLPCDAHGAPRA